MSYMTRTLRHMSIRAIVMTVYIYMCLFISSHFSSEWCKCLWKASMCFCPVYCKFLWCQLWSGSSIRQWPMLLPLKLIDLPFSALLSPGHSAVWCLAVPCCFFIRISNMVTCPSFRRWRSWLGSWWRGCRLKSQVSQNTLRPHHIKSYGAGLASFRVVRCA